LRNGALREYQRDTQEQQQKQAAHGPSIAQLPEPPKQQRPPALELLRYGFAAGTTGRLM
jgi:hypothetical protein